MYSLMRCKPSVNCELNNLVLIAEGTWKIIIFFVMMELISASIFFSFFEEGVLHVHIKCRIRMMHIASGSIGAI